MPKIFVNGQFHFKLSSKTWSHVFLEHSVVWHWQWASLSSACS